MFFKILCCSLLSLSLITAQETRSTLLGRATDAQGATVAGVKVIVRNTDTGASQTLETNPSGYYEANLLMQGPYQITAESKGFKKVNRTGIILPVSSRIEVNLSLEIGALTETISVSAEAPLLETNSVSSGRVIDNKTVMELPVMGNSAMLLVKNSPGIQSGGVNNYLALHSNAGGSDYSVGGNIGGNSWTLDGSPNQGPGRRTAYLPYTDAISEFKVETNNYDASIGQTSGAAITMISKSGSNEFHGTATWQHWQQRWQGTPFFVKQNYFRSINAAEAAGNKALADRIRNTDKQPTGHSNNWGASGGGPVIIPKICDGRNKLFWFFTYNAFKDVKVEDSSAFNHTVPTLIAIQAAASCILLITSGLLTRGIYNGVSEKPGFVYEHSFAIDPGLQSVGIENQKARLYFNELRTRIDQISGVESTSIATIPPLGNRRSVRLSKVGPLYINNIDRNYFDTMRIPLLRGRTFLPNEQNVLILSDRAASRLWPNEDPLGKEFVTEDGKNRWPFIAIAANAPVNDPGEPDAMEIYHPLTDADLTFGVLLVCTTNRTQAQQALQKTANSSNASVIPDIETMRSGMDRRLRNSRTVGFAGLISFAITQRTREIGIRIALGATRWQVMHLGFDRLIPPTAIGIAIGMVAAALGHALRAELYGLSALDPLTFIFTPILFLTTALIFSISPLTRAAKIDPSTSLRHE